MRISDWSSDVCSSDLVSMAASIAVHLTQRGFMVRLVTADGEEPNTAWHDRTSAVNTAPLLEALAVVTLSRRPDRSEEHTSALQSLMRISYAVFCLKKKKNNNNHTHNMYSAHTMFRIEQNN